MAAGRNRLVFSLLVQHFVLLQGAKILTVCFLGGSHYLWMDRISHVLHDNGHKVTMFRQLADGLLPDYQMQESPYRVITWSLDEEYLKEFSEFFRESKYNFKGSYKNSTMYLSLIHRSQPFPKDQQILRWVEHIVTVGGTNHLIPYSYQQPLYQQYLLDVVLFVCVCFIGACYLIVMLLKIFIQKLCSVRKLKQN